MLPWSSVVDVVLVVDVVVVGASDVVVELVVLDVVLVLVDEVDEVVDVVEADLFFDEWWVAIRMTIRITSTAARASRTNNMARLGSSPGTSPPPPPPPIGGRGGPGGPGGIGS